MTTTRAPSSIDNARETRLLRFLKDTVNTFVKWDLVRFFHDNPHVAEISANIAQYIGRDAGVVKVDLAQLAQDGVLHVENISGVEVYRLTPDEAMRALIHDFVTACDDRAFRMKAIQCVITGQS